MSAADTSAAGDARAPPTVATVGADPVAAAATRAAAAGAAAEGATLAGASAGGAAGEPGTLSIPPSPPMSGALPLGRRGARRVAGSAAGQRARARRSEALIQYGPYHNTNNQRQRRARG